jgi:hypothetical protein
MAELSENVTETVPAENLPESETPPLATSMETLSIDEPSSHQDVNMTEPLNSESIMPSEPSNAPVLTQMEVEIAAKASKNSETSKNTKKKNPSLDEAAKFFSNIPQKNATASFIIWLIRKYVVRNKDVDIATEILVELLLDPEKIEK